MTNADALRKIINDNSPMMSDSDEALEFIDAMEDEIIDLEDEIIDLKDELYKLQTEIDDADEEETTTSVFLGLDTIHYRMEKGNLKVQMQFEHWCNQVKKQNCAGVLLP